MNHSTSGLPVHHQLPESTHTHVHRVDDTIQPFHPLSSPFPPALNLSQHQGLFQWVQWVLLIRWPKHWSFSFSISPSNDYSRLISFSIDWFYLAVQCILKGLLQHHNSKNQFSGAQLWQVENLEEEASVGHYLGLPDQTSQSKRNQPWIFIERTDAKVEI